MIRFGDKAENGQFWGKCNVCRFKQWKGYTCGKDTPLNCIKLTELIKYD